MIGIIFADENELQKFDYKLIKEEKKNQFIFKIYKIFEKEVVIVYSGIGISNSAAATQQLISSYEIEEIYNYGSVGGDSKVNVYDLIAPKKIYYHDVITPWYKRGQTPGEEEYLLNNLKLNKNNNLASGSSFLYKEKEIIEIQKEMDVNIFDMETMAIAQICYKNNIKLNVIKCVSDSIGKDSFKLGNINERIKKASEIAFKKMIDLIII